MQHAKCHSLHVGGAHVQRASGVVVKTCLCSFGSATFDNLSAGLKLFGSSNKSSLKWGEGLNELVGDLSVWDIHGLWPHDSQTPKLSMKKSFFSGQGGAKELLQQQILCWLSVLFPGVRERAAESWSSSSGIFPS